MTERGAGGAFVFTCAGCDAKVQVIEGPAVVDRVRAFMLLGWTTKAAVPLCAFCSRGKPVGFVAALMADTELASVMDRILASANAVIDHDQADPGGLGKAIDRLETAVREHDRRLLQITLGASVPPTPMDRVRKETLANGGYAREVERIHARARLEAVAARVDVLGKPIREGFDCTELVFEHVMKRLDGAVGVTPIVIRAGTKRWAAAEWSDRNAPGGASLRLLGGVHAALDRIVLELDPSTLALQVYLEGDADWQGRAARKGLAFAFNVLPPQRVKLPLENPAEGGEYMPGPPLTAIVVQVSSPLCVERIAVFPVEGRD